MTDLLRQEIAALATTIVVKVGTRVLTRDDGQLNEDRIAQLAEQVHAVRASGRKVVLVSSGAGRGRHGTAGTENSPHRPGPSASGGRHRPEPAGRGLRAGPLDPRPSRRPGAADRRGPGTSHPLPQRPQHAGHPARTGGRADHQRERHRQRRGTADHLRRQRPPGGHRDQPAPGAAAGAAVRRGRAVSTATRRRPAAG